MGCSRSVFGAAVAVAGLETVRECCGYRGHGLKCLDLRNLRGLAARIATARATDKTEGLLACSGTFALDSSSWYIKEPQTSLLPQTLFDSGLLSLLGLVVSGCIGSLGCKYVV